MTSIYGSGYVADMMTARDEARRLADAIDVCFADDLLQQATKLLRQWPEAGEPVGYVFSDSTGTDRVKRWAIGVDLPNGTKLYAAPSPEPCCGEFAACGRACTPRGEWLGKRAAQAAQSGMVMVPREPTGAMVCLGQAAIFQESKKDIDATENELRVAYRAMIAAAPQPAPARPDEFVCPHCFYEGAAPQAVPQPQPLTDEQIDEIWDGTFDSADPKRQLSFRQIITRAIERAHGIGITAEGEQHG